MPVVNIEIDLHCQIATWAAATHFTPPLSNPIYRIYVNDDLLTERTWIWSNDIFIKESIWARLNVNRTHKLTIEPVISVTGQARFKIDKFSILNYNYDCTDLSEYTVTFKL